MRKSHILLAITLASAVSSCSLLRKQTTPVTVNPTDNQVETESPKQTEAAISKVLYGEWTVFDVNGTTVTGDNRPYVIFDTTAVNPFIVQVYANNGCNILNGTLAVTPGGEMGKTGEFLSTMKLCPDAPYEMGMAMAFETVQTYKIEKIGQDYLLYMKNQAGENTMVLRKSDISFINGAWSVVRIGDKTLSPDDGVQMVIDVPELRVHGNTGCNILNGDLFLDPDKQNSLQFKNLATTRMMCQNPETEQAFLVALEQVETAVPGKEDTTAQLKDAAGNVLLDLKRLDLKQSVQE